MKQCYPFNLTGHEIIVSSFGMLQLWAENTNLNAHSNYNSQQEVRNVYLCSSEVYTSSLKYILHLQNTETRKLCKYLDRWPLQMAPSSVH